MHLRFIKNEQVSAYYVQIVSISICSVVLHFISILNRQFFGATFTWLFLLARLSRAGRLRAESMVYRSLFPWSIREKLAILAKKRNS